MNLAIWLSSLAAQADMSDGWSGWPFGQGGFWPSVARLAFMALILGVIALVLRLLFGPKGPMRPEGFETRQEAQARREAEAKAQEQGGDALSHESDHDA